MNLREYIINSLEESGPRIALRLQNELKIECPVDKGRLRASIEVIYVDRMLKIFAADYIFHVEFGTKPHVIKAKPGKALKFKTSEGKEIIVKQVNHPGTRPNPFVRDTIFRQLKKIILEELNR